MAAPGEREFTLRLGDGRRLAWRELGAASGFPVFALHGTPGSRLKFVPAETDALRLRLRLIAVDRWGYGSSDEHPRPSLAAFGDDIATLLDTLGVERAAVFGISGGGPYAVAAAARLGPRAGALALVAPVGPIAGMGVSEMGLFHSLSFRVLPRVPGGIRAVFAGFRAIANSSPCLALRIAAGRAGAADRAIVADPIVYEDLGRSFQDGLRQGAGGPVIDMELFRTPWSTEPREVHCPARLWLGTKDRNVPIKSAHGLALALPDCDLITLDGAGHFWIAKNHATVLSWIAAAVRTPAGSA